MPVALADEARVGMEAARALVERVGEHTYGVNTGFGRFVSESIPDDQVEELQLRLLRSHACGVGEPYPDEVVRAAMLLRANALAKGYSGARIETVELLIECLNRGVLPRVPARGSVGASGDLAPLAHLALPLVGEGQAWFDGTLLRVRTRSRAAGLEPIRLAAKEGLSLINGTQFMAAMASLALVRANRLGADRRSRVRPLTRGVAGVADELPPGNPRSEALARAARLGRERAAPAGGLLDHRVAPRCDKVQDAYSLRCAPQVHGASRDLLDNVETTVAIELNAATDNPLVLVDEGLVVSNGNFHGQPLAFGLDTLAMAVAELANISERRVERLVNPISLGRAAAVPHPRGRPQLGLHDPPVRGGIPRVREQVALSPGERRLDPDERRPGGSRLDGQRRRAEGAAGAGAMPSWRWRSSCSPVRRRSSSLRRSSRRRVCARRTMPCASSPNASVRIGRLRTTSSAWPLRSATDPILAAAEAEIGALR